MKKQETHTLSSTVIMHRSLILPQFKAKYHRVFSVKRMKHIREDLGLQLKMITLYLDLLKLFEKVKKFKFWRVWKLRVLRKKMITLWSNWPMERNIKRNLSLGVTDLTLRLENNMEFQVGKCLIIKKESFAPLSILNPCNQLIKYFYPQDLLRFYQCGEITLPLSGVVDLKRLNDWSKWMNKKRHSRSMKLSDKHRVI